MPDSEYLLDLVGPGNPSHYLRQTHVSLLARFSSIHPLLHSLTHLSLPAPQKGSCVEKSQSFDVRDLSSNLHLELSIMMPEIQFSYAETGSLAKGRLATQQDHVSEANRQATLGM